MVAMKSEVRGAFAKGIPSRFAESVKTSHKRPVVVPVRTLYANGRESVVVEIVTANALDSLFGVSPP